tara:strand:+ start:610 stop:852 length:243 start_codon:yes stop_codon:yes gene_type:complete
MSKASPANEGSATRVDPATLSPLEQERFALLESRVKNWLRSIMPSTMKDLLQLELTEIDIVDEYKPMLRVQIWFGDGDYR